MATRSVHGVSCRISNGANGGNSGIEGLGHLPTSDGRNDDVYSRSELPPKEQRDFLTQVEFDYETQDCICFQLEDVHVGLKVSGLELENDNQPWLVNGVAVSAPDEPHPDRVFLKQWCRDQIVYIEVHPDPRYCPVSQMIATPLLEEGTCDDMAKRMIEEAWERWPERMQDDPYYDRNDRAEHCTYRGAP